MEDSIELEDSGQKVHIYISPENQKLSSLKRANGSHQSLAYSNSTLQKERILDSSPGISLAVFELPRKLSAQPTLKSQNKDRNESAKIFKKQKLKLPNRSSDSKSNSSKYASSPLKQQRKTLDKAQLVKISRKNKQLQYALQLQTIATQQLRTKVVILQDLLQQKLKELGLQHILNLKNSSKQMKNIDIYVEMKLMKKSINEKDLQIEKQKQQIKMLRNQLKLIQDKKYYDGNGNKSYYNQQQQINQLQEEKQSLFNYIEELKKQFQIKDRKIENLEGKVLNLEEQLQHLRMKEKSLMEIQRPKLLHQITTKTQKIQSLQQQIIQLKMEHNLIIAHQQQTINNLSQQLQQKIKQQNIRVPTKQSEVQTLYSPEIDILKAELSLLKTERDHYIKEYRKKVQENSCIYELKMKLKQYEAHN